MNFCDVMKFGQFIGLQTHLRYEYFYISKIITGCKYNELLNFICCMVCIRTKIIMY